MSEAKPTYLRKKLTTTNALSMSTAKGGYNALNQVIRELETMQIPMTIR